MLLSNVSIDRRKVHVGVDETRKHRSTAKIDDLRVANVARHSVNDLGDSVTLDDHGAAEGRHSCGRYNRRVSKHDRV
jgi:hypothetical protein